MPDSPNVDENPLYVDGYLLNFEDMEAPTLDFDDSAMSGTGQDEMVDNTLQQDENDSDIDDFTTQGSDNDRDHNYPNVNSTDGVEGGNPEYAGGMGNEVESANVAAVPLPVWPPVLTPFNCTYCHVLREIIHENGTVSMKLEIHGRIGVICHAIQEKRTRVIDGTPVVNQEMVDFTTHSMESVKQFLTQYCHDRAREGFVLWEDPLSVYYNALCSGLDWLNNSDSTYQAEEANPTHHTQAEEANRTPANTNEARAPRTDLASQREKVKGLTVRDLTKCFHLRVVDAAKQLKICSTVLKKKSRTFGIKRWPNRQIKSRTKRITRLENSLREGNGNGNAISQIEALRRELAEIYTINGMMMMAQD
ncbi:hypothetical protein MKW94_002758 [Papaver nudicaule]|uniref:RWP-RK domain-containing protein n=1 Tax=Papaver nudicaule TaxID=74823 RepID=A0AA41V5C4_PAPNU|nr:hypothetical protein [Papaver nudicaule]